MPAHAKHEEFQQRAAHLASQMTLEEKVYQCLHAAPAIPRLNIPAYNYWSEALHGVARAGVATVFPQAIALAATFDEDLVEEIADVISTEGRGKFAAGQQYGDRDIYKGLNFWSPNINIFRDPRWGRGHETFGEDPYLTTRLGIRFVWGLQGHDDTYLKSAACAKHYAVHSGPEDERHSFNAVVNEQDLWETYLPAFRALVQDADVEAVMGAYNRTNGEPCCGSERLLVDILRGKWAFRGHVTSDCWAIKDFHEHHMVTGNAVESVALAMNMGCDLNCGNIYGALIQAVEEGLVEESVIERAVTRLLTTRMKLGCFEETAIPYASIGYDKVDCAAHRALNLKAAGEAVTLLKNKDNILPLDLKAYKTIGVIGPNADNRRALVGNYEGTASRYITILEGIQDLVGDEARVMYSEGCHISRGKMSALSMENDRASEVSAVCEHSDIIIACMGLDPSLEGEEGDQGNEFASGDKPNLQLPGLQQKTLELIASFGKPVVLVLLSGSALAVTWAEEHIPAIVHGFYPGAQGGRAIGEILFGQREPGGRLPITFYRSTEELPDFRDYSMAGRTYRYMKNEALYPFGYGLNYTTMVIQNESVSADTLGNEKEILCRATVRNTGKRSGSAVVQVYVKAPGQNAPNCQLKGIRKVRLAPGEQQEVSITLPTAAFGLYDETGAFVLQAGDYEIFIGDGSPGKRTETLTGRKAFQARLRCETQTVLEEAHPPKKRD